MENLFEERTVEYPFVFATEGALAVGNTWMPTPKKARVVDDATLGEDEVAELYAMEILNPNKVPIEGAWAKLDDALEVDDEIFASGDWNTLMLPPWQRIRQKQVIRFGKPASTNLLQSTTLKYKRNCLPIVLAGTGGISADFTIILHSIVYKPAAFAIPGVFGTLDGVITIVDLTRSRALSLTKEDLRGKRVSPDLWDKLPGGKTQTVPKVWPLLRFGWNAKATLINKDYGFYYDDAEVSEKRRTLFWEPRDNKIVIIEALGIRPHADSHFTALKISGEYMPSSRFYTVPTHNALMFGEANSLLGWQEFFAIPRLADAQVIMASSLGIPNGYRESGGVIHQTTAVVAADNIVAAIAGKIIDMA
ncbi:hypothetical protein ES707_01097 [subsurface metagenome]